MIDQDILLRWATAIAAVGAWIYAWWTRQDDKTDKKIAQLDLDIATKITGVTNKQDDHSARLVKIETQLTDLPSKEDYHKIDISLTEMKGQLGVVIESVKPIKAMASRLQEALLEDRKK